MSRNGSGTYTLPSGNPVVTGTTISSTVHNNTMSDIASEMTASVAKDGQTVITGTIDHNGTKIILDVDADTSITADTDDVIDFEINGVDAIKFGWQSVADTGFVSIDPKAFTADANENTHRVAVLASNAVTIPAGTTAVVSGFYIIEPNITATGTVTAATTMYIKNAPTEGASNYALWVDDGAVRFDGAVATGALTVTGAILPASNDGGAIGVSGTAFSDLFLASGGVINWNAGNYTLTHSAGVLTASGAFTSLGAVGVGAAATDGTLHVIEGSAGAVTASASGNIAVFEAASESGISVLGPDASAMYIMFGTPSNNAWALLQTNYNSGNFDMITTKVGGVISFKPNNQVTNLTLSGASGSQLAAFSGDVTLSEGKLSITDTANEVALALTSSATTANAITITADALTTGSALSISNTSGNTTAKYLLNVTHSAGGSSNAVPARFYTGSAGPILELEQDGGAGGAINFVGANLFAATAGAEEGTILIEIAGVAKVIKYFAVA